MHVGSGHARGEEVIRKLKSKVWWPGLSADMKDWLKYCQECQIHSNRKLNPQEPIRTVEQTIEPLRLWHIDFVGPLKSSINGNNWIITAVDGSVVRWPLAKAVPDATAETIAQFIYDEIVVPYGVPK